MFNYEVKFFLDHDHDVKTLALKVAEALAPIGKPISKDHSVKVREDSDILIGWADEITEIDPVYCYYEDASYAELCAVDFALYFESLNKYMTFSKELDFREGEEMQWRFEIPPLRVHFNKSKTESTPYNIMTFTLTVGAAGQRHRENQGVINCLKRQLEFKPHKEIQAYLDELVRQNKSIENFETEAYDFNAFLKSLGEMAHAFGQEHTKDKLSHLNFESRFGKKDGEFVSEVHAESYEHELHAWGNRICWEGFYPEEALAFLKENKNSKLWKDLVQHCYKRVRKDTWDRLVEVYITEPVTDEDMTQMMCNLYDPNWPGSAQSFEYFFENKAKTLDFIERELKDLDPESDEDWVSTLNWVKEELEREQEES